MAVKAMMAVVLWMVLLIDNYTGITSNIGSNNSGQVIEGKDVEFE